MAFRECIDYKKTQILSQYQEECYAYIMKTLKNSEKKISSFHQPQAYSLYHLQQTATNCQILVVFFSSFKHQPVLYIPTRDDNPLGGLSIRKLMVKIVSTPHFHKKVRATSGLAPPSQLPWWYYIENEKTIWERNDLIEILTLRANFAEWLRAKAWISLQLSNWKPPLLL